MRRIAVLLLFVALVAGFYACSADAPNPTGPKGGGGSNALQISLFTNNANPTAGLCSTVQAVVTFNGASGPVKAYLVEPKNVKAIQFYKRNGMDQECVLLGKEFDP